MNSIDTQKEPGSHLTNTTNHDGPTSRGKQGALELAIALARAADSKKAEDILILDVSGTLGVADYFVIATARSKRQVAVIAEACDEVADRARPIDGRDSGWVVADFLDVILHVFEENRRRYYDLEHLWADAPRVAWTPLEAPAGPAGALPS